MRDYNGRFWPGQIWGRWRFAIWLGIVAVLAFGAYRYYETHPSWKKLARVDAVFELQPNSLPKLSEKSWVMTQREVLVSEARLMAMVEKLDLAKRWNLSSAQATQKIKQAIQLKRLGESAAFRLSVRLPSAADAKEVANAFLGQNAVEPESESNNSPQEKSPQDKVLKEQPANGDANEQLLVFRNEFNALADDIADQKKLSSRLKLELSALQNASIYLGKLKDAERFSAAAAVNASGKKLALEHQQLVDAESEVALAENAPVQGPISPSVLNQKSKNDLARTNLERHYQDFLDELSAERDLKDKHFSLLTDAIHEDEKMLRAISQKIANLDQTQQKSPIVAEKPASTQNSGYSIVIHSLEPVQRSAWRDWLDSKAPTELFWGLCLVLLIPYFLELLLPARRVIED